MYEECEIDKQCDGTNMSGVCKEIGDRKLCLCKNGYEEENNDLICRKGKKLNHVIYQLYYEDIWLLILMNIATEISSPALKSLIEQEGIRKKFTLLKDAELDKTKKKRIL